MNDKKYKNKYGFTQDTLDFIRNTNVNKSKIRKDSEIYVYTEMKNYNIRYFSSKEAFILSNKFNNVSSETIDRVWEDYEKLKQLIATNQYQLYRAKKFRDVIVSTLSQTGDKEKIRLANRFRELSPKKFYDLYMSNGNNAFKDFAIYGKMLYEDVTTESDKASISEYTDRLEEAIGKANKLDIELEIMRYRNRVKRQLTRVRNPKSIELYNKLLRISRDFILQEGLDDTSINLRNAKKILKDYKYYKQNEGDNYD